MEAQMFWHNGGILHVEPVEEVGLYSVHAVKGVVSDLGLLAVQIRRLGDEQAVGIASISPEIEDCTQLPATD